MPSVPPIHPINATVAVWAGSFLLLRLFAFIKLMSSARSDSAVFLMLICGNYVLLGRGIFALLVPVAFPLPRRPL